MPFELTVGGEECLLGSFRILVNEKSEMGVGENAMVHQLSRELQKYD